MAVFRKGVFFVVYCKDKGKVKFLILKRKLHWIGWEFPKGGIEKNENEKIAVFRELKEETGLKARKLIDFHIKGKFDYHKEFSDRQGIMGMTWHLYAVDVFSEKGKVKIDKREHNGYKWLDFEKAYKTLTWANQKRCLKIVEKVVEG